MRNERLFEKIKETALTETTGTDEYDPDKIWSDIQQKAKKTRTLWWHYAAASVVLAVLVLLNIPETKQQNVVVSIKKPGLPAASQKPLEQIEGETENLPITHQLPDSDRSTDSRNTIDPKLPEAAPATVRIDTGMEDLQLHQSGIAENQTVISEDPIINQSEETENPARRSEKVLVAHIDLPDEQTVQQSGLQRVFDQVKKDREARKMRLQFNRNVGKLTLWSFVHQSFVEKPPVIQMPKKPNQ
ncbi:hypothetical protein [Dyadobacter aurulentus]|uniref:hypothetical protein n=1 Tax=Dyadobacter sp. UC 10 TaxID=2605428 RepID=UPI0011F29231|nr:hypothetical protein [Dyadobacter sp. UC 10]KAA0993262.1 hypothetical protein FXO21_25335 [Dyadobacter sp. UC 10]